MGPIPTNIGRVAGDAVYPASTLNYNYAKADMGTDGGAAFSTDIAHNSKNGANFSAWGSVSWTFGNNDTNPWVWSGSGNPKLYWE